MNFILYLKPEMNLQLYQWGLVCTERLQTSFVYLIYWFCSPFAPISFQDFKNTTSYCKIPHQAARSLLLVTGTTYSLLLFVLPQAHMLNLLGADMAMAYCPEILSFL